VAAIRLHRHPHHGDGPQFAGRASRVYDVLARRLLRRFYRRLAADIAATAPTGAGVLDVGTGPAVLLTELARLRPDLRLTGVDLSPDMIRAAARNVRGLGDRVSVRVGSVTDLPFTDRSFDLIVSSLSLHHWDDPAAAVPELARVLRPGGRVLIYDFRSAPFARLRAAARDRSLFTGGEPRESSMRTGVLFFPRCVRYELTAAPA
jgi:ubiquinone/menaquinone biosynthesis C-methylase UbiE